MDPLVEEPSGSATTSSRHGRSRKWIAVPLFSAALLIPCFWQSRIQAADLSSHIYNAWLASLIRQGAAPGLWISFQSNNILFDLILDWLFGRIGPDLAQRTAVSVSVLVFGWGALLFIFRVAGRNWWFAAPCVAMLAYGFVFHIGFFNFYLSMGLCLLYLSIIWDRRWRIQILALPLLVLAWVAHPFPVVWALGITAYVALAKSQPAKGRCLLLALGMAVLVFLRFSLMHRYQYEWSERQIFFITGVNQLKVFGSEYAAAFTCLLIWLRQFGRTIKRQRAASILLAVPFHLWMLNAAAVFLMPNQIMFPQFAREFAYITTRLSLGAAVLLCAVIAAEPLTRFDKVALVTIAGLFFGLLYRQERQLNRVENRIDSAVQALPPMRRVIWKGSGQSLYWLCLQHDVDRACIGHCFSYGNYEPSSEQFRIRAQSNNGIVLSDHADVDAVRKGSYTVQARDLPMQMIYPCDMRFENVCSRPLRVGEISGQP